MMKGVSAVIALILILMIVVALAALAYTWFTSLYEAYTEPIWVENWECADDGWVDTTEVNGCDVFYESTHLKWIDCPKGADNYDYYYVYPTVCSESYRANTTEHISLLKCYEILVDEDYDILNLNWTYEQTCVKKILVRRLK